MLVVILHTLVAVFVLFLIVVLVLIAVAVYLLVAALVCAPILIGAFSSSLFGKPRGKI